MKAYFQTLLLLVALATFILISNSAYAQIHVDSSNDVAIGSTNSNSSKLRIYNNSNIYTLRAQNYYSTSGTKYGINNYVSSAGTGTKQGFRNYTYQNSSSSSYSYGIYNRLYPYGTGRGYGIYNYLYTNSTSTGVKYGIYSYIRNSGTGTRYGIYSSIAGASGYAGYFIGNVYVSGTVISTSDRHAKEDVKQLDNALALVNQIEGKTYRFKNDAERGLPTGQQYGFIAQELEQIVPELVEEVKAPGTPVDDELTEEEIAEGEVDEIKTTAETTFKSVNYIGMIPILVEAIKEQQELIEQQQVEIEALKAAIRK